MTARARTLALAPADLQRRRLLLGAGLVTGFAALSGLALPAEAQSNLSAEDRAVLQQAQTYLQGLTSAQGTFTEVSGPQNRAGRFYLQHGSAAVEVLHGELVHVLELVPTVELLHQGLVGAAAE